MLRRIFAATSVAAVLYIAVRWLQAPRSTSTETATLFLREVRRVFARHRLGSALERSIIRVAVAELKLRPTVALVRELLALCGQHHDEPLSMGTFAMLVVALHRVAANVTERYADVPRVHVRGKAGHGLAVFLGGSCNPTTWRAEVAVPVLVRAGVTFYNPQVDSWSPDLLQREQRAKDCARLLFFVLDDQTRGIASMVEIAFLAASGCPLVVMLAPHTESSRVDGQLLQVGEYRELGAARAVLWGCLLAHAVPVFEDLHEALAAAVALIKATDDATLALPPPLLCAAADDSDFVDAQTRALMRRAALASLSVSTAATHELMAMVAETGTPPPSHAELAAFLLHQHLVDDSPLGAEESGGSLITRDQLLQLASAWSFVRLAERPPSAAPAARAAPCDVCLCGAGGLQGSWGAGVMAALRAQRLSWCAPASLRELAAAVRGDSRVVLLVIPADARAVGTMVRVAYALGGSLRAGHVVVCVEDVVHGTVMDGELVDEKQAKDLNRGRSYVVDFALQRGARVCTSLRAAVEIVCADALKA